ncbi:hypothetical protein ILUMI_23327 [Ignelater luminosus]|uniref:Mannose-6-phosphate isomerase n=1 Tax=Ignelater luminosus TaxID=2038154 RepID=A0A8K0C897_IGNLU|nr:hypothetical protein ILUMI_23327 [Ignelater luminosus]
MELKCQIQTYDWGKIGTESKVASLYKIANPEFEIGNDTPYAELWMGTHTNGPSENKLTGESLSSVLNSHPEYLGEPVREKFDNQLPFLFKLLSINKALSIQAHPAKQHAELLHREQPNIYKDPNHKPELAIALTPFEALCGFRPINEIQNFVKNVRELRAIIGTDTAERFLTTEDGAGTKEILKECFKNMMTCSQDQITEQLKQMLQKFSFFDEEKRNSQLAPLVERLYSQFPNDVGCFAVYFLNYLKLKPLEALYLGPNEPHAYLYGECVECMACSDNVVRAGLTPKYKDVETLCFMLTYDCQPAELKIFKPTVEDKYCEIFKPPVPDFAVAKIMIPHGEDYYQLPIRNSASILFIVGGSAKYNSIKLKNGSVFFVTANEKIVIENVTQDLLMFQAMANL